MSPDSPPNPHQHLLGCQVDLKVTKLCPACQWDKLHWSHGSVEGKTLAQLLTGDDETWLREMNISAE